MWEALRSLRRQLAEEHSVPPYVIFPDSTLLEMLREQPEDLDDMAQISGVGARKLERYGAAFLRVLNHLDSPTTAAAAPNSQDLRHELVTLARSGMTPEQISQQMQCSLKNVYSLMAQAITAGLLSVEDALDLPEQLLGDIHDAFLQGDGELPSVASIAEQFTPQVEEGVLYCVRAALQAEFGNML
jgi:ATP-dependent DNA helicase RecQ